MQPLKIRHGDKQVPRNEYEAHSEPEAEPEPEVELETEPEPEQEEEAVLDTDPELEQLSKRSLDDDGGRASKRSTRPEDAVLRLLADLLQEHGELDDCEEIVQISEDLLCPHAEEIWALYDSGAEVPFLCGMRPPNNNEDEACCQRLWHKSGECICPENATGEWGYMNDGAWTCKDCYHTKDTLRECSKAICPNYNELGRCERCQPSTPW